MDELQLIYKLPENKHYYASGERFFSSGTIKLLFAESENKCWKCGHTLEWNIDLTKHYDSSKLNRIINSKSNQIAHIYGRRSFFTQGIIDPSNLFHIKNINEIDMYRNLIVLCSKCHAKYDSNTSYKDYLEMISLKNKIIKKGSVEKRLRILLDEVLNQHVNNIKLDSDIKDSNFNRMNLKDKIDYNKITKSTIKNKIKDNVLHYYDYLNSYFCKLSSKEANFFIAAFKESYKYLKTKYHDSNELYDAFYLISASKVTDDLREYLDILVPYFFFLCEVFESET